MKSSRGNASKNKGHPDAVLPTAANTPPPRKLQGVKQGLKDFREVLDSWEVVLIRMGIIAATLSFLYWYIRTS